MSFTDCVTCTHSCSVLLPTGFLLRSHNEIFNPEEAGITHMFCRRCDSGRVYRCLSLGATECEQRSWGGWEERKRCIQRGTEIAREQNRKLPQLSMYLCARSISWSYAAAACWAFSGNMSSCVPRSRANLLPRPLRFSHSSSGSRSRIFTLLLRAAVVPLRECQRSYERRSKEIGALRWRLKTHNSDSKAMFVANMSVWNQLELDCYWYVSTV